jgi:hypothetical protein
VQIHWNTFLSRWMTFNGGVLGSLIPRYFGKINTKFQNPGCDRHPKVENMFNRKSHLSYGYSWIYKYNLNHFIKCKLWLLTKLFPVVNFMNSQKKKSVSQWKCFRPSKWTAGQFNWYILFNHYMKILSNFKTDFSLPPIHLLIFMCVTILGQFKSIFL